MASTTRPRIRELPRPVWPVVALAAIQAGDGVASIRPIRPIAQCWEDVNFPRRFWPLLPLIKAAATAGLLLGTKVRGLGAVTTICLIAYFLAAISAHVRARDFGRNLFVNATGMLIICITVLWASFVRRPR